MKKLLLLLTGLSCLSCYSQNAQSLQWWNPIEHSFHVIEGQAWPDSVLAPYDRLPAQNQYTMSTGVWTNSRYSAGLMIRFRSNSTNIHIRYTVAKKDRLALNHMPATGVSGLDLYAIDSDGQEVWCAGKREFADTVIYRYQGLKANDRYHQDGREYRLYLPLFNQVEWLEIGVEPATYFAALPVRPEKPIVVYGTSIAHGACASRPGMAWTAILGREMDRPLINLGFSGSGRLEKPMIDLLAQIDAKVYILDCLPNLIPEAWKRASIADGEALKARILAAVRDLRAARPETPILLVEHAGYTQEWVDEGRQKAYRSVNQIQLAAYYQLKKEGVTGLYYLTKEEIGLELDDMVDGTHPTDLGMRHYADSYEQKLREILHEPIGTLSTTKPCTQYREPNNYDWEERHRDILEMNQSDPAKTVILANSIVHFWGGLPRTNLVREAASWEDILTPMGVRNFAYGWDRIENVLWRVYHGELDGFDAERIILMIGTNNLHLNTDEEIIAGLDLLIEAIKVRQPHAEIVLIGLLPRRDQESRLAELNLAISRLAGNSDVAFADLGEAFLKEDQSIKEDLFSDGLHPNAAGYLRLREALIPFLSK
ncbi:MAG: SGNH/GDSL hydrolase family protein [Bacteroidia bacterium]